MGTLCGARRKHSKRISSNMIHVDEEDPVGEVEPSFPERDVTIKRGVDAEEFYELLNEIGRGKFGTVYRCREKASGLELAAKVVSVSRREDRRNAEREVDVMQQLRHPRLIQLYDAFDSGKVMCVVLELITGGELFERVIDDDFVLTEKACTVFMRQICEGIEFVHQQNILHLDMKPENILCLTKTGNRIKIIDFGLARKYDPSKKLQVLFGTPEFVAPEVVNFDQIGFGTDMWSVGVICYVLLSGLSPFMGETDIATMANVTIAKYDFDDEAFNEISEDAKDFIRQLLVKDKEVRLTAKQCVAHKWLRRRPPLPPKPTYIPPKPAYILKPKNELDVAKENLRLFVERWSEHPNSPYLFDVCAHEITPCLSLTDCRRAGLERSPSEQSLGGCSPSPCGSINSLHDYPLDDDNPDVNQNGKMFNDDSYRPPYVSYHSLERRASDSSCFVNKKADVSVRVNLAEEIKKLSDHLYMLSTMNTDLGNNNNSVNNKQKTYEENNVTERLPNGYSSTSTVSSHYSTCNGCDTSNAIYNNTTVSSGKTNGLMRSATMKCDVKPDWRLPQNGGTGKTVNKSSTKLFHNNSFHENSNGFSDSSSRSSISNTSSSTKSQITSSKFAEENESGIFNNLPWARRKFKITSSSRDVPLAPPEKKKSIFGEEFNKRREKIDNLVKANEESNNSTSKRDTTKHYYKKTTDNGDVKSNANNTKDLLLHLLEEWDTSQGPPADYHSGRHKSISMEWSEADKVAPNSISTLNDFFRRQSATNATASNQK